MFGGEFPLTKSMEPLESFIVQTSSDFSIFAKVSGFHRNFSTIYFPGKKRSCKKS